MSDLSADIDRGERARRLLEEPLLKEAFEAVRNRIISDWQRCDPEDAARGQSLRRDLEAAARIEAQLRSVITTGRMAAVQEQQRSIIEKAKRYLWKTPR